ncbi:hypothetical protein [Zhihengliuella sp.]|uniref:O-antigen ligase family protein n=1 Tax=Zhihengliuella sp. TaxID=1954483 RepID=UPI0028123F37|nr:hypothetical protein [Zhihengliuella sp.]
MREILLGVGLVMAVVVGLTMVRLLFPRISLPVAAGVGILAAVAVPRSIVEFLPRAGDVFSTVGPPVPTATTYGAMLVGCLLAYALERRRLPVPKTFLFFIGAVAFAMFAVWEGSVLQWSGVLALVLGILAWGFGRVLGRDIYSNGASARYLLVGMVLLLLVQLGVSTAQVLEYEVPSWIIGTDRSIESLLGRASGTVGHPANLAKIAFLVCVVALPFTLASRRDVRSAAWWVVALSLITSGLTISRANLAAHFLLVGLWVVTLPGKARFVTRLAAGLALAATALIFLPPVLDRFEIDETGGQRPVLLEAAWVQLSQNLWEGTGPNAYISVVGAFDAVTASGLPVHNAFLLYTAELGLVLAVLFYAPILLLFLRALKRSRRRTRFSAGRALVFALPGYLMITLTGWSLMANFSLVATMLVFGIYDAAFRMESDGRPDASRPTTVPRVSTNGTGPRGQLSLGNR